MSSAKFQRLSGIAAAIGSPLFFITFLSHEFWNVLNAIGIADNDVIHPLLADIGLLLMAVGLVGLYRRLPVSSRVANNIALGIALFGIFLAMIGTLSISLPVPEILMLLGLMLSWLGIAAMGFITLSKKALGNLSFVPLALVASALLFALTIESSESAGVVFVVIYMACWVLLGYALWIEPKQNPSPAPVT